jgi:hypothetical protein
MLNREAEALHAAISSNWTIKLKLDIGFVPMGYAGELMPGFCSDKRS